MGLLVVSLLSVVLGEFRSLDQWNPPVARGSTPALDNQTFAIFSDAAVWVYAVDSELTQARFLWKSPGPGQGPGEINPGTRSNSLQFEPGTGRLWLSHRNGLLVFDPYGKLLYDIRFGNFSSNLAFFDGGFFLTAKSLNDPVSFRKFPLSALEKGKELFRDATLVKPLARGIPVLEDGSFIERAPALRVIDKRIFWMDPFCGEFYSYNLQGLDQHQLSWTPSLPDMGEIKSYLSQEPATKRIQVTSSPLQNTGIAQTKQLIWLLRLVDSNEGLEVTLNNGSKLRLPGYNLVQLGLDLEIQAVYSHKDLQVFGKSYLLFAADDKSLFLFDQQNGEEILILPISELKRLPKK